MEGVVPRPLLSSLLPFPLSCFSALSPLSLRSSPSSFFPSRLSSILLPRSLLPFLEVCLSLSHFPCLSCTPAHTSLFLVAFLGCPLEQHRNTRGKVWKTIGKDNTPIGTHKKTIGTLRKAVGTQHMGKPSESIRQLYENIGKSKDNIGSFYDHTGQNIGTRRKTVGKHKKP